MPAAEMSHTVISVESLSKRYLLGHHSAERANGSTLRDTMVREAQNFTRKAVDVFRGRQIVQGDEVEEFWALKDVNFEVQQGDVVGIIGRNGAGKSTLLKILSRITEPTEGRIELRGRVASLLEVGTGFHQELSGRENIFLNGAILGMTQREIRKKFDEIVAFAEVERFLDTPVKHYSSGMYVRLAFSVAAHLEPEILIIDEVLAVGDAEFQRKCLGKISNIANDGRTILFVSHNMRAIQAFCTSAILLLAGRVQLNDSPQECAQSYLMAENLSKSGYADLRNADVNRRGSGRCRFETVELLNGDDRCSGLFAFGEPFRVRININSTISLSNITFGFSIFTGDGIEIMGTAAHDSGMPSNLHVGNNIFECSVSPMILTPGRYTLRAAAFRHSEVYDHVDEILSFEILNVAVTNADLPKSHYVGAVYIPYEWKVCGECLK